MMVEIRDRFSTPVRIPEPVRRLIEPPYQIHARMAFQFSFIIADIASDATMHLVRRQTNRNQMETDMASSINTKMTTKKGASMNKTIIFAAIGAMLALSGSAVAQGKLDSYMPGDMMGMKMSQSVFDAFFSDKEGKVARPADEFMTMYGKMSQEDKMIVRIACSVMDKERAGFSDHIQSACKAAGIN
jgi:hypothetical protein